MMSDEELEIWAKNLRAALDNEKICPRKKRIIELQFLEACVEITNRKKAKPS